jgi:hypothetical protein
VNTLRAVTLTMAFLLELAVLAAVGYRGFTLPIPVALRVLAALGAPVLMAILWGLFASPRAPMPLPGAVGVTFQICWFALGALALVAAGRATLGGLLAAVYVVNSVALLLQR